MLSQTHLSNWGNSQAIRIPKKVLNKLNLTKDQNFNISIKENSIVLTPTKKKFRDIHDLFDGWKDDGIRNHELDWGTAKGNEIQW